MSSVAGAEPRRDLGEIGAHVAVVVQVFGQFARDQPLGGIGKGEGDLLADMVAQGDGRRGHVVHVEAIGGTAGGAAAAGRLPLRRQIGSKPLRGAGIVRKDVLERAVELVGDRLRRPGAFVVEPVALRLGKRFLLLQLVGRRVVARLGAVEQRIALDLLVDETIELDMGKLQQPDRLHQLRRHHQRLRLPQLQFGGQRHL